MDIYQDLKEFIESLEKNKVEYLVVGGYAVSFYSEGRYTKDIDVWINNTRANAKKLLKAFDDFGFGRIDVTMEDLLRDTTIIQ